jgi:type III pantothenate kinase
MMLLTIDIGNTHTVAGLFKNKELLQHWRISSNLARTEDEVGPILIFLFEKEGFKISEIQGVAISSVVPDLTPIYMLLAKRYFKVQPLIINYKTKLGLEIKYHEPSQVGADRLCNAVAGIEKYGKPLIVLDFGTATTFDCIDRNGDYLGGIISPGIDTSIKSLHLKAAKLPLVEQNFPKDIIGRSTEESIQSGIMFGILFMLEALIREIKKQLGDETKVVATGGLAKKIAKRSNSINFIDPYLSLDGIASIYYMNTDPN